MPKSRIPSPARSQGAVTPRRSRSRRTLSVGSPALSTASGRLTSVIEQFKDKNIESFAVSPLNSRRSVLTDNTEIEEPKRRSWWKNLNENSQDVMEILQENKVVDANNPIEELMDIEILSQEKKNYTLDLPECSDSESINSIVLPQRKLFTQKENQPQKKFGEIIGKRESSKNSQRSNSRNSEQSIHAGTKELFQGTSRTKPVFPAALLNISPNKTTADKTKEFAIEPKPQVRNIFGNRPATKRKNMFAEFVLSESEDEIPEIQPKVFGFPKKVDQRRGSPTSRSVRGPSPASSITTDTEMDEWKHLPSSTMVENQIEDILSVETPVKKARLSKLSEAKESEAGTNLTDKTAQSNKSSSKTTSENVKDKSIKPSSSEEIEVVGENNTSTSFNKTKPFKIFPNKETSLSKENEQDANLSETERKKCYYTKTVETHETDNIPEDEVDNNGQEDLVAIAKQVQQIYNEDSNYSPGSDDIHLYYETEDKGITKSAAVHRAENVTVIEENAKVASNTEEENKDETVIYNNKIFDTGVQLSDKIMQVIDKGTQNYDINIKNREVEHVGVTRNEKTLIEHEKDGIIEKQVDKSRVDGMQNDKLGNGNNLIVSQAKTDNMNTCIEIQNIEIENEVAHRSPVVGNQENPINEAKIIDNQLLNHTIANEYEDEKEHDNPEVEQADESMQQASENGSDIENDEDEKNYEATDVEEDEIEATENKNKDVEDEVYEESDNLGDQEEIEDIENKSDEEVDQNLEESDEEIEQEDENENIDESQEIDTEDPEDEVEETTDNAIASDDDAEQDEIEELEIDEEYEQNTDENEIIGDEQNEIHQTHEEIENTPNSSHSTATNRKKYPTDKSPEVILHDNTNQNDSFTPHGRNTSVRQTKSMYKGMNIRPSIAPPRESTGMSDGTKNSSAEGSGWDSHRTTRKTLRQTFGKDFTLRKSLRALVMEKSAKQRQTEQMEMHSETVKLPRANSTELPDESNREPMELEETVEESDHEVSIRTRRTTLEMYLQKIKQQNLEKKLKMEETVRNSLKAPSYDVLNLFKVPSKPPPRRPKPLHPKPNKTTKSVIPLGNLPSEVIEDMKYKPPKRFQPANASWITKRLYKFLETKLEQRYDYKARVRAEKLVQMIYNYVKDLRRHNVAPIDSTDHLKHEMARLDIVKTHYEFYEFFHDFMPREVRIKVVPDIVNRIALPRHGVFSDILRETTVQGYQ